MFLSSSANKIDFEPSAASCSFQLGRDRENTGHGARVKQWMESWRQNARLKSGVRERTDGRPKRRRPVPSQRWWLADKQDVCKLIRRSLLGDEL